MRNILVITWWPFSDALVQAYTLPYVRLIRNELTEKENIFLVTLEKRSPDDGKFRKIDERIFHLPLSYSAPGLKGYFGWKNKLNILENFIHENKITHLHTWCAPAGGIGWKLKMRTKLPLIADSFEPHADPMVETGTWKKNGPAYAVLKKWETNLANDADILIANSPAMRSWAEKNYGMKREVAHVKPACVDTKLFSDSKRKNKLLLKQFGFEGKTVLVYAGKFGGLYYDKESFEFFRACYNHWKDELRILVLTPQDREMILAHAKEAGIPPDIITVKFVPHNEMPDHIGLGDFGFCPIIPTASRRACSPIKNGEYWAMGLPLVICKGVSVDDEIVESANAGAVLESMNENEYKKAIAVINTILKENEKERVSRIRKIAEEYRSYSIAQKIYHTIYGKNK
ncbi:MAG: glycosyltransferase [Bacteroidetes bacterium]|nr:glycosyltransferase [Bacteroidota bacterium]